MTARALWLLCLLVGSAPEAPGLERKARGLRLPARLAKPLFAVVCQDLVSKKADEKPTRRARDDSANTDGKTEYVAASPQTARPQRRPGRRAHAGPRSPAAAARGGHRPQRLARPPPPEGPAPRREPGRLPGGHARARRPAGPAPRAGRQPPVAAARARPGPALPGRAARRRGPRRPRPPQPAARRRRRPAPGARARAAAAAERPRARALRARLPGGRGRARGLLRQRVRRERDRARRGRAGHGRPAGDAAGGPRRAVQAEPPVRRSRRGFPPRAHPRPGRLQLPEAVPRAEAWQQVHRDGPHLPQEAAAARSPAAGPARAPAAGRRAAGHRQRLREEVQPPAGRARPGRGSRPVPVTHGGLRPPGPGSPPAGTARRTAASRARRPGPATQRSRGCAAIRPANRSRRHVKCLNYFNLMPTLQ